MTSEILSHPATAAKTSRRWLAIAGVVILGLAGFAVWRIRQVRLARLAEAEAEATAALVAEIATVTALGRLEPEGEIINLTAPTSVQESRIDQLLIQEGDRVEAGQIIAVLDNHARLQAALQQAEERVRVAQAALAQVEAGAQTGELNAQRAEIARLQADRTTQLEAQRATVARLQAEEENARVEYERYESLYQQGAVSASERDTNELTYTTAERRRQEAQAELARIETTSQQQIQQAESTFEQIAEVRPVDVAAAEAEIQAAIADVAEAQANLDQASVKSPLAGQIIEVYTRPGEIVGDEGIATLGETEQMIAIAEIYENDIAQIQIGQPATITATALPDTLQGTVDQIGLQVEQQQVVDEDPAANLDARVVEVHVRLDPASSQKVAGLTNLQVTVAIQTDS